MGLQVWRGAFLLADFLLHYAMKEESNFKICKDDIVVELGAGTGLTSIVAGIVANHVVSTGIQLSELWLWIRICYNANKSYSSSDISKGNILSLIDTNIKQNSKWTRGKIEAIELDFYNPNYSEKLVSLLKSSTLLLAADGRK